MEVPAFFRLSQLPRTSWPTNASNKFYLAPFQRERERVSAAKPGHGKRIAEAEARSEAEEGGTSTFNAVAMIFLPDPVIRHGVCFHDLRIDVTRRRNR